ncbi:MAB_1171c family putative transporter [Streptomyces sp. GbtcB7]|uniref:MAB_1171c family putative transporter n=1 Tax=Streptomyces sp. GbtcB7 TaxID=2824752 RepID=UPI001C301BDF|nr:MAB_1171c family putative transporter [Streptomyces sp. GbtcB7]
MTTDCTALPAHARLSALNRRLISSRELLDLHHQRIQANTLNAVVTLDIDEARQAAGASDDRRARGQSVGHVDGLPLTIKDSFETVGLRTTCGAEELCHHIPARDADAVARLRHAGAVIMGKSNVPAYCQDLHTDNTLFGAIRNPHDPTRTPGGSSGGAAAAVAAALTTLELGSELAGSLRLRGVALGATITLGYSEVRIGGVIADAFDTSLAEWENFAWTCGDVGAMLTLIGWLVPTITDQARNVQYRIKQYRSYRGLRPLWLAFYSEASEIALPIDRADPAQRRRFRGIGLKLYRRVVEIHDGRFVIRQYLDAGVRERSEAHRRAKGLHGEELNAAVTADQVLAGIAARAGGNHSDPARLADFADADRQASRPMGDIDALLAVARHLPREPARTPHPERASA